MLNIHLMWFVHAYFHKHYKDIYPSFKEVGHIALQMSVSMSFYGSPSQIMQPITGEHLSISSMVHKYISIAM